MVSISTPKNDVSDRRKRIVDVMLSGDRKQNGREDAAHGSRQRTENHRLSILDICGAGCRLVQPERNHVAA